MIKLNINVAKIDKSKLFKGEKGTYLNAVLKDHPDDYGNDGFIAMDTTKEERESGVRGEIIGKWKHVGGVKPQSKKSLSQRPAPPSDDDDGGEIPF